MGGILDAPVTVDSIGAPKRVVTQPLLRPISWRANHLGGSTYLAASGKEHASFRVQHRMIQGVRAGGIRLLYGNHCGSIVPPSTLTVKADLQFLGRAYPVYFGGNRSVSILPGGNVLSDPLPVTLSEAEADSYFYTLTYVDAGVGGRIPVGLTAKASNGEGSNLADATAGGADLTVASIGATSTTPSFTSDLVYSPMAVLGVPSTPKMPAVLIVGDSISIGAGDGGPSWSTAAPTGDFGYILRGLQNSSGPLTAYLHSSKFGETGTSAAGTPSRMFRGYAYDYVTHVIEEYGVNDVQAGTSAAAIELARVQMWRLGADRGKTVYATTLTPRTTSTDSWATTGNQTVQTNESVRVAVNTWLRAGAPVNTSLVPVAVGTGGALLAGTAGHPLTAVLEVTDLVETARNSGIWKAGYTGDGVHPTATGHAAAAAAISSSLFVVS